ncbi:Autophagy-related protein 17 [Phaffia rhodozyma]|uniref:Autophagy-related protein 17 n=1 Tax=Phaffia rhodozyma TaxID=264483 RepID=A0A0F7SEC9_PHARH|nr:Autophagy-related protein 17 [Phaffia rhodozyma]
MSSQTSLLDLVLTSKRALSQAQHVRSQVLLVRDKVDQGCSLWAETIATKAERQHQLSVLSGISIKMQSENHQLLGELEKANETREHLLLSLSQTLLSLSQTIVPPSIHQNLVASSSSLSSLFGDNLDRSSTRSVVASELPSSKEKSKTLRDFIDEQGLDRLVDELDLEQEAIETELEVLLSLPSSVLSSTDAVILLNGKVITDREIETIIRKTKAERSKIVEAVEQEIDGLTRHWEQVSRAMKEAGWENEADHGRDDGRYGVEDEEELQVLMEDTAHLPLILNDIEHMHQAMIRLDSSLRPPIAIHPLTVPDPTPTLNQHKAAHQTIISAHLPNLQSKFQSVEDLNTSFIQYREAFGALLLEVDRRESARREREHVVSGWQEIMRKWEAEEDERRSVFLEDWADSLPADLCPSIGESMEKWDIKLSE